MKCDTNKQTTRTFKSFIAKGQSVSPTTISIPGPNVAFRELSSFNKSKSPATIENSRLTD